MTASKPTTKVTSSQIAESFPSVSVWKRPFDIIIIAFYLTFIASTAFFDYHNVLAPALGVTVRDLIDKDIKRPLDWPPAQFTKTAFRIWGEQIDPVMITNPHFWQIMEWINVVFMTFGNAAMALAFTFGWRSFRTLGIVHATSLLYSLVVCIGIGMYGGEGYESVNKFQFLVAYSLYVTFPIVIIGRLWYETPNVFCRDYVSNKPFMQHVLEGFCVIHIFFFIFFFYHWILVNTPYVFPGSPPPVPVLGPYLMELSKLNL
ncbi:predicted protein [Naegleria gruberi]|uniref:Predicted protein n=1 Tax=Naegleria gruberi TaxID=5762 RepID=D2UYL6_NAEGR|nr:uncharacterized protein NAEGRDRAFT_61512 [Naegleria gruberi]EFC50817.1 predicted protein [Naegleria gruberi]|eukprot:XP_002683561.1 predicted protein [Naegleria gruberi strain NEG-M]